MRISDCSTDGCPSELDELAATAYAVIDGADGRTHHVRFDDLDMTGDAQPGAIVELRSWDDARGNRRLSLATRSDLPLADQVPAAGPPWLDRPLLAREPVATGTRFGPDLPPHRQSVGEGKKGP